ncbi:MAG: VOC family protein, partial [Streptosporangiaceae bacterium]
MPRLTLTGTNIDAPDANALADFYRRLLGWATSLEEPGWVILRSPGAGHTLNFQTEERYARPAWPAGSGDQQMMMHLEIQCSRPFKVSMRVPFAVPAGWRVEPRRAGCRAGFWWPGWRGGGQ